MNIQYFLATTIIFEYIINIEYIQSSIYYTPTMGYRLQVTGYNIGAKLVQLAACLLGCSKYVLANTCRGTSKYTSTCNPTSTSTCK